MITTEQWRELIYAGIWQLTRNIYIILKPMLPGIISLILVGLIILIIKKGVLNFLYQYFLISGNSKKSAKRKVSKVENVMDLISSVKDIHITFK